MKHSIGVAALFAVAFAIAALAAFAPPNFTGTLAGLSGNASGSQGSAW